jgi:hypothetical protein
MTDRGGGGETRLARFSHSFEMMTAALKKRFFFRKRNKVARGGGPAFTARDARRAAYLNNPVLVSKGCRNLWYECEDRLCSKFW